MLIPRRTLAATLLAVSVLLGTAACGDLSATASSVSSPVSTAAPAPATPQSKPAAPAKTKAPSGAFALLATLPVKGKAPMTGYDRTEDFGRAWLDVDHNGCDTRNDELASTLTDVVKDGPCKVLSGTLHDPYTGKTIHFVRGNKTSTLVQIDHVVALGQAWESGAQKLTQEQREALANDPTNLIPVDGPTNSQKGKADAATWLPPQKSFRCTYVTTQIRVKAKYGLSVNKAEQEAMVRVLGACDGSAPVPAAPAPAPAAPPAAEPAPPADKPAVNTIHPGSWCNKKGAAGVADNGKTYTCGKKGPDKAGKFHWNA